MTWIYKGKELIEIPLGFIGFVYIITNLVNDKKYIGKKNFYFVKYKQVKKKKKRTKIESDWKDYYSSSPFLKKDVEEFGKDKFKREILHLCSNKAQMNYLELKEQIFREVLERDDYYNDWIFVRIRKCSALKGEKP